jgi:hypothetical protein
MPMAVLGGHMERPALQDLLADIRASRIDIVVIYKVDRLARSLADRGPLRRAVLKCSVREQISEARRAIVTCFPRRSSCHGSAFEVDGVPGLRATRLPAYHSQS